MNETTLHAEFADTFSDDQAIACRRLWNAVLLAQLEDMVEVPDKGRNSLKYHQARGWFGDFPSGNFAVVCALAGHDPDAVWQGAIRLNDSDEATRKAALKRMVAKQVDA